MWNDFHLNTHYWNHMLQDWKRYCLQVCVCACFSSDIFQTGAMTGLRTWHSIRLSSVCLAQAWNVVDGNSWPRDHQHLSSTAPQEINVILNHQEPQQMTTSQPPVYTGVMRNSAWFLYTQIYIYETWCNVVADISELCQKSYSYSNMTNCTKLTGLFSFHSSNSKWSMR